MKTQMQTTSLFQYAELQKNPKELGRKQREVLKVIKSHPAVVLIINATDDIAFEGITNNEIANILGWSVNRITGRCKELRDLGLVKECCKRPDIWTKKRSIAWEIA